MSLKSLLSLVPLLLTAACSTYVGGYDYRPSPAVAVAGADEDPSRVFATVRGVLRGDAEAGVPHGIDVQIRVEAPDARDFRIADGNVRLITADLVELPLVLREPDESVFVAAGERRSFRLVFGFPDGADSDDFDLDGLALAWNATLGDRRARGDLEFERLPDWGGPAWHVGVGHHYGHAGHHFGFAHHHWGFHNGWWAVGPAQ